jgi:protoporphyrinogen oxidase
MAGKRIAVLGAGPMGLAVAYQLAADGHAPVLFEAAARAGGMSASFDFGGMAIERYYHFHCISDHAFLRMIDELGLAGRMHWVETRMGYFWQGKVVPWGNPAALLRFPGLSLAAKLRYGLHAFLATRRTDWRPLDGLEATAWIRRWVGDEAYEVLWRRLFDYKFHRHAQGLSAAWIWSRIRRIGRSRYDLFREKLGYLEGGSDTLIEAMQQRIEERGGQIRLGTAVTRVRIDGGAVAGLETAAGFEPFEHVVSTIPLPYVPDLMPDLPADVLARFREVENISVVCVIARLAKRLTENFWLNVNDTRMDIPGLVEYTNLRPLDAHVVYVPYYMPADHPDYALPDQAFLDRVRDYMLIINPQLAATDILEMRASRYRHAQPVCPPGFAGHLPPAGLPVRGLWVADTSYYYPEDRGISESIGFGRELAKKAAA